MAEVQRALTTMRSAKHASRRRRGYVGASGGVAFPPRRSGALGAAGQAAGPGGGYRYDLRGGCARTRPSTSTAWSSTGWATCWLATPSVLG